MLIALALALLLGWYVAYTQRVVVELRRERDEHEGRAPSHRLSERGGAEVGLERLG